MGRCGLIAFWIACTSAAMTAMDMPLSRASIDQAIAIGQSRVESDRIRFHLPYRLQIARAPVDYIDVVTPFRRVEIEAEKRAAIGDRSFGQRQTLEMFADSMEQLELWIEFTFHPLNTYVLVPEYTAVLIDAKGAPIEPRTFDRVARYGPRVNASPFPIVAPGGPSLPGRSQPMNGATVFVRFDGRLLNVTASYEVMVSEGKQELARAKVDLARLR